MKTPREIYAQYRIMPSLQLHQLRVAAVAVMLCDNRPQIDARTVLLECLFHDMGNIVKSDLEFFPDFVQPEGRAYWEAVKKEFLEKYGPEQHVANAMIAGEIGLPPEVIDIMNASGFGKLKAILENGSTELKVCQYADMRVGPHGILPMRERLEEGRDRYKKRSSTVERVTFSRSDAEFEELAQAAQDLEWEMFSGLSITPAEITDSATAPIIEKLWDYQVS